METQDKESRQEELQELEAGLDEAAKKYRELRNLSGFSKFSGVFWYI